MDRQKVFVWVATRQPSATLNAQGTRAQDRLAFVLDPALSADVAVSLVKRWQVKLQASGTGAAEVKD